MIGRTLAHYRVIAPIGAGGMGKDVKTGRRTLWKEIRPPDPSGVDQVGPMRIAPDETSYVYSYRRALDELYLATGLK